VELETSVIYPFFCFFGNSCSKEETAGLDPILEEDTKKGWGSGFAPILNLGYGRFRECC
jgi:hypothetical protein